MDHRDERQRDPADGEPVDGEPAVGGPDEDRLFSEANAWFFRLQSDDLTPVERTAFAEWLARSPAHSRAWGELRTLLHNLKEPARAAYDGSRIAPPRRPAMAAVRRFATAMAVLLVAGGLGVWRGPTLYQNAVADQVTSTGQRRTLTLPDGSTAEMNGNTALVLDFRDGERRVRILRGEAWFHVTRDPDHPFVVDGGAGAARVLGTQFSVRREDDRTTVTVGEGLVEVAAHRNADSHAPWPDSIRLHPGESAEAAPHGLTGPRAVDPAVAFAWRQGQIVFRQQSLASVITALNQQWPGRVVLLNDEAAERVVSGVFALDRPDAVFDALERGLGVRAIRITPYLTLLEGSATGVR
ncbi:FecR family protein (plasmid) [Azospirillum oryzae]|uniref:FecR family protein n=1 Tax=Azospirillum oryzae TaxID=286727 RepID=A0A6N1AJG5_9PROT|nr:FecR family protein [Azospirillum oryzae]KAA0587445.1 FecR family protein [Azospirillum oryzae]QKS50497.1 FecR family protein [Azospirillum oryzae]GLR78753.1 iron dicitrate transporter FecR [Azospirillum oryzae]